MARCSLPHATFGRGCCRTPFASWHPEPSPSPFLERVILHREPLKRSAMAQKDLSSGAIFLSLAQPCSVSPLTTKQQGRYSSSGSRTTTPRLACGAAFISSQIVAKLRSTSLNRGVKVEVVVGQVLCRGRYRRHEGFRFSGARRRGDRTRGLAVANDTAGRRGAHPRAGQALRTRSPGRRREP